VMSYSVSERTREIGIRMALGAQPRNVLALVLRQGLVMTLSGLLAGIVIALAGARLVAALLIGVGGTDPLTYAAASVFLCVIALLATWIPARRATRVDPMTSLRCQ
jgi:putative ABC transport system permease protein